MKNQDSANSNDNEYLIIPNPIYDVVFRYLMQDHDSAMIILSTLINEKIIKLDFRPVTYAKKKTEEENVRQIEKLKNKRAEKLKHEALSGDFETNIKDPKTEKDIKLVHLDFTAIIELPDGTEEMVMIELQKAENDSDIFRFREYIAENLMKKRKQEVIDPDTNKPKKIETHYRLIPIFILNFAIESEIKDLMIKTKQLKSGIFTNKNFETKNQFIEELSYEIYVAQLPYLNEIDKSCYENDEYKSKLYALLKLFDQDAINKGNEHRLRLAKRIFPEELNRVIKRLQSADIDNPDLEKHMKAEDHYLRQLLERDNKISFFKLKYSQTEKKLDNEKIISKQKDIALEKKDIALEEKDIALKEKDIALEEKDIALEEKDMVLEEKDKELKLFKLQFAKSLKTSGKTIEEIQEETKLSKEEIEKL